MAAELMDLNRTLLVHFDSYSAALHFAKWGDTLLAPSALPPGAKAVSAPASPDAIYGGEAVKTTVAERLSLKVKELVLVDDFHQWFDADGKLVRVHLLRFDTFEPPKEAIEATGGIFKPISELRGSPREELALAREVFNLIIGAGGGRA